ncbi:MAG: hypothetical protein H0T39_01020 [Actinobacteria bacterium]|nr:hypothetical protein [Actinomycetota bacterium]
MTRVGLTAGLIAALAATLTMTALRVALGIPLPFELTSDRFLPFVPVEGFVAGLGLLGGALLAKQIGFYLSFLGQLALGAALGTFLERRRDGRPLTRRTVAVTLTVAAALWLLAVAVLWPALRSNYEGAPPGGAAVLSALGLLAVLAVFALSLLGAYAALARRAP